MVGSINPQTQNSKAKAICADGTTGAIVWQSGAMDFALPTNPTSGENKVSAMTDIQNGTFYLVGSVATQGAQLVKTPLQLLLGLTY